MKIVPLSLDITRFDIESNLHQVEQMMPHSADIVVLPELFTTGFTDNIREVEQLAETIDGSTINTLKRLAPSHDCAICGSFLAKDDDKYYNRGFIILPDGNAAYYDKHHLFSLGNEAHVFTPGNSRPPIIDFRGSRVTMMICYDLRFPVWLRRTADFDYDVMLIPANWPQSRGFAWQHLLIARAIENQAYVIGANRSGADPYGEYDNLTFCYDYFGRLCDGEISQHKLQKFRQAFPVQSDADPFTFVDSES